MKQIQAWVTSDGKAHTSFEKAQKHADERYGNALTKLAHELLRLDKYLTMSEFLDKNLSRFKELTELRADILVENPDPEGED